MLNLINMLYRLDTVTIDIINALGLKMSDAEDKINNIYKQIFLDYADWYLEMKEREMAVSERTTDTDTRRAKVKTRLLGVGTATKELLESTANSVSGVEVEILFEYMTVFINFLSVKDSKYLEVVRNAIAEMIPYHLDLKIRYKHINWSEVKEVTWGDVYKFTWGSLANDVEGTLINS